MNTTTKTKSITNTKLLVAMAFLMGAMAAAAGFTTFKGSDTLAASSYIKVVKYVDLDSGTTTIGKVNDICRKLGFVGAINGFRTAEISYYASANQTCSEFKFIDKDLQVLNPDDSVGASIAGECTTAGGAADGKDLDTKQSYRISGVVCYK